MNFPRSLLHCLRQIQTGLEPKSIWFWVRDYLQTCWQLLVASAQSCCVASSALGPCAGRLFVLWCVVSCCPPPVTKHVFAEGPTCVLCGCQPQYGAARSPWRQPPGDLSESDEPDCPAEGTAWTVWEGGGLRPPGGRGWHGPTWWEGLARAHLVGGVDTAPTHLHNHYCSQSSAPSHLVRDSCLPLSADVCQEPR